MNQAAHNDTFQTVESDFVYSAHDVLFSGKPGGILRESLCQKLSRNCAVAQKGEIDGSEF